MKHIQVELMGEGWTTALAMIGYTPTPELEATYTTGPRTLLWGFVGSDPTSSSLSIESAPTALHTLLLVAKPQHGIAVIDTINSIPLDSAIRVKLEVLP